MERDENVKSIEVRLAEAKREVSKAQEKVRCINIELKDAMQQVFEQRLGVNDGDIITTKSGTKYYYERFIIDSWGRHFYTLPPCQERRHGIKGYPPHFLR